MKSYTFTLALSEQRHSIPYFSENDMEDVVLEIKYSTWTERGKRTMVVNEVIMGGVNVWPVLLAFNGDAYINRLAEENYEFRLQEAIARNYQNIHRDAMAGAEERVAWQRIK